jgi:hypothetical protein
MKLLYSSISWAMAQGALALICTLIYNYVLIDLFKTEVTYIQWFGMIIVSACILPTGRKTKTNNEPDAKSKIETFISSMTKKK